MVGTVQMQALMRIAETLGIGRLVLVGDTAQLRAVDAGGPFRLLQRAGMAVAVMDEILRQRTPELKAAVDAAVDREPALAVERLGDDVHEVDAGALGETAARIWLGLDEAARRETVLLAPTHELRERINATLREALAEEGVLHGRTLTIERLVSRGMTRAQKGDIRNWVEGDEAVFLHDIWGGKARAGECFAVAGIEDGRVRLEHADGRRLAIRPDGRVRYQVEVYETRTIEIRAGDRIRWTRNDNARGLANGDRAEVTEIGPRKVSFLGEDGRAFALSRRGHAAAPSRSCLELDRPRGAGDHPQQCHRGAGLRPWGAHRPGDVLRRADARAGPCGCADRQPRGPDGGARRGDGRAGLGAGGGRRGPGGPGDGEGGALAAALGLAGARRACRGGGPAAARHGGTRGKSSPGSGGLRRAGTCPARRRLRSRASSKSRKRRRRAAARSRPGSGRAARARRRAGCSAGK